MTKTLTNEITGHQITGKTKSQNTLGQETPTNDTPGNNYSSATPGMLKVRTGPLMSPDINNGAWNLILQSLSGRIISDIISIEKI